MVDRIELKTAQPDAGARGPTGTDVLQEEGIG
jgi:hypothetical protein